MIRVHDLDPQLLHEGLELGREREVAVHAADLDDGSEAISIVVRVQVVLAHVGIVGFEEGAEEVGWVEGVSRRLLDDRLEDWDIYASSVSSCKLMRRSFTPYLRLIN